MTKYLTVKEVAALLRVSNKTIYKKKREIPGYFNLAGLHFFDEEILTQSLREPAFNPNKQVKTKTRHDSTYKDRHGLLK